MTRDPRRLGSDGSARAAGCGDVSRTVTEELLALAAHEDLSVQRVLQVSRQALQRVAGVDRATVYQAAAPGEHLALLATTGSPVADDEPAQLLRLVPELAGRIGPGTSPVSNRRVLPLHLWGRCVGVLVLTGTQVSDLPTPALRTVAHHLATTVQALADREERHHWARSADAFKRLFEEGAMAPDMETAGRVLAAVAAEVFGTERAGVHLVDADGCIRYAFGVGISPRMSRAVHAALVGRSARDSPVWRSTEEAGGPVLVDDRDTSSVRAGGFVATMQLRSYLAMPLLSATGLVGMAVCGDRHTRAWSDRDRKLAARLALQGAVIIDSVRLRQAERWRLDELTWMAHHDSLTGLPNRFLLMQRLDQAARAAKSPGERAAVLLIDLNGFKQVNDTLGHHAGDALLQLVAQRLLRAVRPEDTVARLGGDEFALLLAGDHRPDTASGVARRIHQLLGEPFVIEEQVTAVGASIGIALLGEHATDATGLLRCADSAMYHAKRQGTGPQVFAGPGAAQPDGAGDGSGRLLQEATARWAGRSGDGGCQRAG